MSVFIHVGGVGFVFFSSDQLFLIMIIVLTCFLSAGVW